MVVDDEGVAWVGLSDAALLTAARRDPEAFGVFYQRHAPVVLAFFYRRTACVQTSADLTAETQPVPATATLGHRHEPG